jgi:hypothetical protein
MAAAASAGTAGSTPRAGGRWLRLRCAASRHGDASAMGRCYVLIDRGLLLLVVFAAGSYAPLLSHASCLLSVQTCRATANRFSDSPRRRVCNRSIDFRGET